MEPQNTPTPSANDNQRPVPTAPGQSGQPGMPQSSTIPGLQRPSWQDNAAAVVQPSATFGNGGQPSAGMPASAPVVDGVSTAGAGSKKKRLMLASAIIGAVMVLGGGSAAAYYGYIVPNKPQNILNLALVNEFKPGKVNTQHMHGTLAYTDKDSTTVNGTFKGAIDSAGPFDVAGDVDATVTKVTFDMRSPDSRDLYVRLGGLDGLSSLLKASSSRNGSASPGDSIVTAYAPLIDAVNNHWFVINQSLLQKYNAIGKSGLKLSDSDRQKLVVAYKDHQFLIVRQKLADEKISGHASAHLQVVIDKQQLKDFMAALKEAKIDNLQVDSLDDFNKGVANVNFDKYPVDVWVSKSDRLVDQVALNIAQDGTSMKLQYTVDSWNDPVKVAKPADAKSLLELLGQAMGTGSGTEMNMDMNSLMDDPQGGSGISL